MHKLETLTINIMTNKMRTVFNNSFKLVKIRKTQRNELKISWTGGIIQNAGMLWKNHY